MAGKTTAFQTNTRATTGPLAGSFLWSDPGNWTNGVPVDGDTVQVSAAGYDDIPSLTLTALQEGTGADVLVFNATLTIGLVTTSGGSELASLSQGAPASVTVGSIAQAVILRMNQGGGLFAAIGDQATLTDNAATDSLNVYVAQQGGTIAVAPPLEARSVLAYFGAGTIEAHPEAYRYSSSYEGLDGVQVGDVLELPGAAVTEFIFGQVLILYVDKTEYIFATASRSPLVNVVTNAVDPATGLLAVTFGSHARPADFYGNGTSDQLWQAANGDLIDYSVSVGEITGATVVGALDSTWTFLATGDFNGDGTADQLWRAADGSIVDYTMKNGAITGGAVVGALDSTWKFLAAADFNGDGTDDQLWQAANGDIVLYTVQHGTIATGAVVGALDSTWKFLGAGDFDGSGTADQLWQAADGAVVDYAMNHGTITTANVVGGFAPGFKFLAVADFNGDGTADQLWQAPDGTVTAYTMSRGAITGGLFEGVFDSSFKFLGTGDYLGVNDASALWQRADGAIVHFYQRDVNLYGYDVVGQLDPGFKFLA